MSTGAHRVILVVVPDCTQLGLAVLTEAMFVANWLAGRDVFDWRVATVDGLSVRASNGAGIAAGAALSAEDRADSVFVVASFDARAAAADARLLNWLRRMARFGAALGGIETGSEILAEAGLMEGHAAAVHWYNREGFAARFPGVTVADGGFTRGRGRMTAAGGMAVMALALDWIGAVAGADLSAEIGRHLMAAAPPAPAVPPLPDGAVARALAAVGDEGADLGQMAAAAGLSRRQLQRRFRAATGATPGQAAREARLARAHQLVQQTGLSVTEIAMTCGFGSVEHFSRSYRARFGRPPREDRRQSVTGTVRRVG
jgi:AraC family carnitine catabolism transcriptional activator